MGWFKKIGHFFSNAAKAAGRPFHSALHAIVKATGAFTKAIGKIPLVGPALHGAFDLVLSAPFKLADDIVSGRRIDHAVLDNLKQQVSDIREVAPYAQTVISLVPGVGQGISGVIGGGLALASGQSITKAIQQGVESAIPGGPIAKSLAKVGMGVMSGKPIDQIGLDAIPIPDNTKKIVGRGIEITKQIASGHPVDKVIVEQAYKELPMPAKAAVDVARRKGINPAAAIANQSLKILPADVQKAIKIGMAVGHGRFLQLQTKKAIPDATKNLAHYGEDFVLKHPPLIALRDTVHDPYGFYVGIALMQHKGTTPFVIRRLRASLLPGDQRKGFDLALSAHVGLVTSRSPKGMTAKAMAGYYATKGMQLATSKQKKGLLTITSDPAIMIGAKVAAKEMQYKGLWHEIKKIIGIER